MAPDPQPACEKKGRWLGTAWLAACCVLALVLLEAAVVLGYEAPTRLQQKVGVYLDEVAAEKPHVVVFGTCVGMSAREEIVEQAWGAGVEVVNLSAEASTPLDWYLIASRSLKGASQLGAIVLAPAGEDLRLTPYPWSNQTLELLHWGDLPEVVRTACYTPSCAVEMALRRGWRSYRYRGFLGSMVWSGLGLQRPGRRAVAREASGAAPMNFRGEVLRAPQGAIRQPDSQRTRAAPRPRASQGQQPSQAGPPQASQAEQGRQASGFDMGWRQESSWLGSPPDEYHWFRKIVLLGQARGVPVILFPMPADPSRVHAHSGWQKPEQRQRIQTILSEGGAEVLDPGQVPELEASMFSEVVHIRDPGRPIISRVLGEQLRQRFPPGEALLKTAP